MNQLISYAIIGVVSNISGYLIYLLLTFFFVGPKMAMTAVYLTSAIIGFLGNQRWTFSHNGRVLPTIVKYVLAQSLGYSINFVILFIFVDRMSYPHQLVQAIAIGVVAIFLFLFLKKIVFSD